MNTILIAENNIDFAYAIQWYFENEGYNVFVTPTGEEAQRIYDSSNIDIILLDINLDGTIDGKSVVHYVRSKDKNTPIILMSGESKSPMDVVEGLGIGANYFLKKPLAIAEIDAHVKVALQARTLLEKIEYRFSQSVFLPEERIIITENKKEYLSDKENRVFTLLANHIS